MAGRLPLGNMFSFLQTADSHPPLDYLLQLPLARLGANPFVFRLPAALCSIAALALFAWWMRDRGRVGVAATAAMAICAFQIAYGREARMYGPMELIGVGTAVVAESWLRNPRRAHSVIIGALTFVGLMTHISMALMAIGLLALPLLRRDADAWRWRGAVAAGAAGWALVWGPSFLVQSRGGHSSWIPHTTPARFLATISSLVTSRPGIERARRRRGRRRSHRVRAPRPEPRDGPRVLLRDPGGPRRAPRPACPGAVEPHAHRRGVGPAPRDRLSRRRRLPASPRRRHGRGRRGRTPHARLGSGRPDRARTNGRARTSSIGSHNPAT